MLWKITCCSFVGTRQLVIKQKQNNRSSSERTCELWVPKVCHVQVVWWWNTSKQLLGTANLKNRHGNIKIYIHTEKRWIKNVIDGLLSHTSIRRTNAQYDNESRKTLIRGSRFNYLNTQGDTEKNSLSVQFNFCLKRSPHGPLRSIYGKALWQVSHERTISVPGVRLERSMNVSLLSRGFYNTLNRNNFK